MARSIAPRYVHHLDSVAIDVKAMHMKGSYVMGSIASSPTERSRLETKQSRAELVAVAGFELHFNRQKLDMDVEIAYMTISAPHA